MIAYADISGKRKYQSINDVRKQGMAAWREKMASAAWRRNGEKISMKRKRINKREREEKASSSKISAAIERK